MDDTVRVRSALLSVSEKTGIAEFARGLSELGIDLLSTGGTAQTLRDAGLAVRDVQEVTGFPEMLDGRVKTLHPKVHGGILARRDIDGPTLSRHGIDTIDLVCVNLYPFERTVARPGVDLAEAIEQIDIGGPSMIRSAAKNAAWVTCVTDPEQYVEVLESLRATGGTTSLELRRRLARAAFERTAAYDRAIADYLTSSRSADAASETDSTAWPERLELGLIKHAELRYGENPHQPAAVYRSTGHRGAVVIGSEQLHGKPLSYNNMLDAAAALRLVADFHTLAESFENEPLAGAVVIKHTNPCGASMAPSADAALAAAIDGDRLAAFGGIVALNRTVDDACAALLTAKDAFFEVLVAPAFEASALATLQERFANIRLLAVGPMQSDHSEGESPEFEVRSLPGGALVQQADTHRADPATWTHRAGPEAGAADLQLAAFLDTVCRGLTSNAVAIGHRTSDGALTLAGGGAGQMDRVASCRIAIEKAGARARGGVAASDAFFPFSDGPSLLIDAGIKAIVHPGGSKRDGETFAVCAAAGVTCLTTGIRRFRH